MQSKRFQKTNIHCSKYQIYGQWVNTIGVGLSYSVEDLGMAMLTLTCTSESGPKPW